MAEAPASKRSPERKAAAAGPPGNLVRARVVLYGRVAGVGLRTAFEQQARAFGVAGWIRNNADGTVEAVFEGNPQGVSTLVEFARKGPPGAVIEKVDVLEEPPEGLTSFSSQVTPPAEAPTARRPYRVGFAADSTGGVDMLGIQERVEFVGSVLAAKQLETPLAVGLFGDWGSGKSFFMRRMQECVARLAELSAQAEEREEPSLYCSYILQIPFNAWLYSDSDIWPSLAARVFRSVAGHDAAAPEGELQTEQLSKYRQGVQEAAEVREQTLQEEAALEQRIGELDAEIAGKEAAVAEQTASVGGVTGQVAQTLDLLSELRRSLSRIAQDWRRIRLRDILVLAALPVALLIAWLGWDARVAAWVAAATAALALAARAVRYVDGRMRLEREIDQLRERRSSLAQQREASTARRTEAEGRLGGALAVPLLPEYAAAQATLWAGRERLGVVTEIRLAFERLSGLIETSRLARAQDPKHRSDQIPVDRVIVYVDDLDRCSHDVVIAVLESIKVLLDLPHFVVVVGVDSRWLFRAIQVHFADVLRPDGTGRADDAWAATPQNYLEKIFQYSLVLRPMGEEGFGRLIDSLLAHEPSGSEDGAGADGEEADRTEEAPPQEDEAEADEHAESAVDLTPDELVVTPQELQFMKSLAPLYETPRAAKRLANIYRLIRVTVGADQLDREESYEPVLVLLSIAIAFPALAGDVFRAIPRNRSVLWDDFVHALRPQSGNRPGIALVLERELSPAESNAWTRLADALEAVGPDELSDRHMEEFEDWIKVVADFSFHPWQELLPAGTRA